MYSALIFLYFEILLANDDSNHLKAEATRLKELNSLLGQYMDNPLSYEDFVEETLGLFEELIAQGSSSASRSLLFERLNNDDISNYVIMHFRVRRE